MKNLLLYTVFVALTLSSNAQTVTDIDGNVYNTVTIGTQTWMAENLKTTKYSDGTAIPFVIDDTLWGKSLPAYCWYNNDMATYKGTYGALYNWFTLDTASNGGKNVCPAGWHVPSYAEWTTMLDYLGGEGAAKGKLMETGTAHWSDPYPEATNETGFTALPGGYRSFDGSFNYLGCMGYWGSSSEIDTYAAWNFYIVDNSCLIIRRGYSKDLGISVRCVQDNNTSITNSINPDKVIFYPNPATERLYLKNSNYANTIIMIFDLLGKQVLGKQIDSDPIDISNLRKGIYVVKLVCSKNVLITKFIKE
jgi:uncharacterized protein (TIGR02145 family)